MRVYAILLAILPAIASAQDGAGSPNPLAEVQDNPAIASASSATAAANDAAASIVTSAVATASSAHANATNVMSGETTVPATRTDGGVPAESTSALIAPSGAVNGSAVNGTEGSNGTNGANETVGSGAFIQFNSMPIAAMLAAAGLAGAAVL